MAFLDYAGNTGASRLDSWKRTIGGHDSRPHPVSTPGGEGCFIYEEKELDGFFSERDREVSWKGVIDALNSTPLNGCVTYQVLGFYEITGWRQRIARTARALLAKSISLPIFRPKAWSGRRTPLTLQFLLSQSERRIEPVVRGSDCWYELPMGGSILLRIIAYRPTSLPSGNSKTLVLAYDRQAFQACRRVSCQLRAVMTTFELWCLAQGSSIPRSLHSRSGRNLRTGRTPFGQPSHRFCFVLDRHGISCLLRLRSSHSDCIV